MTSTDTPLLQAQRHELLRRELHVLLSRAFERIRPIRCKTCTMPEPFRITRGPHDAANWTLPVASTCEYNCGNFIRWLSVQFGRQYDLADEE